MELLFLGTGAADRKNLPQDTDFSNKDHRRCSCALINGSIMIDCGPHALNSLSVAGVSLYDITDIIVTHRHSDHFDIESINKIASCGGVRVWLRSGGSVDDCLAEINFMELFKPYEIGSLNVTAVPANHEQNSFPQHLCITDGDKKLLYALDGAWVLNESAEYLKRREFNAIVIDTTIGDYSGDMRLGEHNSIPMVRLIVDSMRTLKIINESSRIILSHIACCLHKSYEETCKIVAKDGFIVGFDGMRIDI
ncbi:MAG: MBL fold metallo-hydrolase [Clostridia bacterium]|nr:MBL fold metallo-hydrolase [Clostridia bacterium]